MSKDKSKNFGSLLKRSRAKKGISQEALRKVLGVHGQFISNIERNLAPFPTKSLKKIVSILSLDENEVIDILLQEYKFKLSRYMGKARN